jgi:hypothetical protein
MTRISISIFAAMGLAACTSTYHPEYHPVTATSVTQNYSGGAPAAQPGGPVIIEQPPVANPDEFFNTSYR